MSAGYDEIKSVLDRLAEVWKTNDGEALAGLFTEDGSLINPFGERADGRAAIAAMYGAYFDCMLGGTATELELKSVRDLGGEHAFVDAEQVITAPDGSVVLTVHNASLLRREADGWRLVDARPYAYAAPPPQQG
jgi:uncharacterized protein (TIGR02246 family)